MVRAADGIEPRSLEQADAPVIRRTMGRGTEHAVVVVHARPPQELPAPVDAQPVPGIDRNRAQPHPFPPFVGSVTAVDPSDQLVQMGRVGGPGTGPVDAQGEHPLDTDSVGRAHQRLPVAQLHGDARCPILEAEHRVSDLDLGGRRGDAQRAHL